MCTRGVRRSRVWAPRSWNPTGPGRAASPWRPRARKRVASRIPVTAVAFRVVDHAEYPSLSPTSPRRTNTGSPGDVAPGSSVDSSRPRSYLIRPSKVGSFGRSPTGAVPVPVGEPGHAASIRGNSTGHRRVSARDPSRPDRWSSGRTGVEAWRRPVRVERPVVRNTSITTCRRRSS